PRPFVQPEKDSTHNYSKGTRRKTGRDIHGVRHLPTERGWSEGPLRSGGPKGWHQACTETVSASGQTNRGRRRPCHFVYEDQGVESEGKKGAGVFFSRLDRFIGTRRRVAISAEKCAIEYWKNKPDPVSCLLLGSGSHLTSPRCCGQAGVSEIIPCRTRRSAAGRRQPALLFSRRGPSRLDPRSPGVLPTGRTRAPSPGGCVLS